MAKDGQEDHSVIHLLMVAKTSGAEDLSKRSSLSGKVRGMRTYTWEKWAEAMSLLKMLHEELEKWESRGVPSN